jgi:hypothetical protein
LDGSLIMAARSFILAWVAFIEIPGKKLDDRYLLSLLETSFFYYGIVILFSRKIPFGLVVFQTVSTWRVPSWNSVGLSSNLSRVDYSSPIDF